MENIFIKRFWEKVEIITEHSCWEWIGAIKPDLGYGRMYVNKKPVYPHRFSYELHFGPIPKGLYVCHTCDNRSCVRPEHLFIGSAKDNTRDMIKKGRNAKGKMLPQTIL